MTVSTLDTSSISQIRKSNPWIQPSNLNEKWLVCSADLDGLLSLALIKDEAPNAQMAGFYSGETLFLTDDGLSHFKSNRDDFIGIDHDLKFIKSIGQHLTLLPSADSLNPNVLWGAQDITSKYPFGTLPFLFRLFKRTIPSSPRREACIRHLFYPDGGLMKNLQYKQNCKSWLRWLDLGVTYPELQQIKNTADSKQLGRCLYKMTKHHFGSGTTQASLLFNHNRSAGASSIANQSVSVVLRWVNWMAGQCGISSLGSLPSHLNIVGNFTQYRVSPSQDLMNQLQGNLLSEALVQSSLWSVTPKPSAFGNENDLPSQLQNGSLGLPQGLSSEPSKWVKKLNLNASCDITANCVATGPCTGPKDGFC